MSKIKESAPEPEALGPWLPAVKEAMREAAYKQSKGRRGLSKKRFNYRWEHVKAVVLQAKRLAKLTGADTDIVIAAAWLHDVRKEKGEAHPEFGARFAEKFLPRTDFPPEKIAAVAEAIRDHMGLWRDTPLQNLESQVLWDADKLTKIGVTGAIHYLGAALLRGRLQTSSQIIKDGKARDWQEKTVASMHTEPAKKAAASRLAAYKALFQELDLEITGSDLKSKKQAEKAA
ncbi:MAG: HD domain-containing protein [Anaerolineales bacterium]|nr:HD domain-containing protein [Anaerolineales bacterium]MCB0007798.1 HD domain-containing protein [Anaerolineales bacterium]MCB0010852.1 HD domain-containing protein [Anaerolineales bacterium]MCB0020037.1 HD domain-containing protein [Anaerolineales bacterium]MCB0029709.1 HD domain-containing protein [Anaerolineales bacterium]